MFGLLKKKPVELKDPIGAALRQTTPPEMVDQSYIDLLKKGTRAEQDYAAKIAAERSGQEALAWALERSQQIDLFGLLKMRTAKGFPVWSFVSPYYSLTESYIMGSGDYVIRENFGYRSETVFLRTNTPINGFSSGDTFKAKSFPILPDRVREMIKDPKNESKARFMGVLYKQEDWAITKAPEQPRDPALIVQWRDVPGYFCLAIWGREDRPQIQEFING